MPSLVKKIVQFLITTAVFHMLVTSLQECQNLSSVMSRGGINAE